MELKDIKSNPNHQLRNHLLTETGWGKQLLCMQNWSGICETLWNFHGFCAKIPGAWRSCGFFHVFATSLDNKIFTWHDSDKKKTHTQKKQEFSTPSLTPNISRPAKFTWNLRCAQLSAVAAAVSTARSGRPSASGAATPSPRPKSRVLRRVEAAGPSARTRAWHGSWPWPGWGRDNEVR
jgi:hypothetical protein